MKTWYKSKTVWGGILLALSGLITAIGQLLTGELNTELFMASVGVFLKGVWDVYNRFITTEPIE